MTNKRFLHKYSCKAFEENLPVAYRPLMRVRISRPRREFGHEGFSYIERDAGESNTEIKVTKTGYFTKKKVLEIGL